MVNSIEIGQKMEREYIASLARLVLRQYSDNADKIVAFNKYQGISANVRIIGTIDYELSIPISLPKRDEILKSRPTSRSWQVCCQPSVWERML